MIKSFKAIEELAKLEQRMEMKKGKFIALVNTKAVKSLNREDKEEFYNYLKGKGKKFKFLALFSFASLIAALIFRKGITGFIIIENTQTGNLISSGFFILFVLILIVIFILRSEEKQILNKFREHTDIIEKHIG